MFTLIEKVFDNICCCSVAKSCLTLCDPMNCSSPASLSFTISWSLLKLIQHPLTIKTLSNLLVKRTKKNLLQTPYLVVKLLMLSTTLWSQAVQQDKKEKPSSLKREEIKQVEDMTMFSECFAHTQNCKKSIRMNKHIW